MRGEEGLKPDANYPQVRRGGKKVRVSVTYNALFVDSTLDISYRVYFQRTIRNVSAAAAPLLISIAPLPHPRHHRLGASSGAQTRNPLLVGTLFL